MLSGYRLPKLAPVLSLNVSNIAHLNASQKRANISLAIVIHAQRNNSGGYQIQSRGFRADLACVIGPAWQTKAGVYKGYSCVLAPTAHSSSLSGILMAVSGRGISKMAINWNTLFLF